MMTFRVSQPRVERCGDGTYLCPTCAEKAPAPAPNPYAVVPPHIDPKDIVYTNGVPGGYATALKKMKEQK